MKFMRQYQISGN